jgi:hypothetical protein
MRLVFRERLLLTPFEELARSLRPTEHVLPALDHLFDTLDVLALSFGDESNFYYDYGSPKRKPYCFHYEHGPYRRWIRRRNAHGDLGPKVVDPPPEYPTPYQKWLAPLVAPTSPS